MLNNLPKVLLCATFVVLSGCSANTQRQDTGMIIGGVLGGVLGNQVGKGRGRTAAIILGTMAGAAVGGSIGRTMDETDRMRTSQSLETVRNGVSSTWNNPDSGHSYAVTPTRTYEQASGPCREYTLDAIIGGKQDKIYGTACRQADGSWKNTN